MPSQKCEIVRVLPIETRGAKGFKVGHFHAKWSDGTDKYPHVSFAEFTAKGRSAESIMEGLAPGAIVEVEYRLEGREWDRGGGIAPRVFNDLVATAVRFDAGVPGQPSGLPKDSAVRPYDPKAQYRPGDLCYRDGVTYQLSPDGRQWNPWRAAAPAPAPSAPAPSAPASPASGDDMKDLPF